MAKLRKWCDDRGDCFGHYSFQGMPVDLYEFQDEILAVAIGTKATDKIDEGLHRLRIGKYDIKLRTKAEETKPFGSTVTAICGTYDLEHPRRIHCSPSPAIHDRYVDMVPDIGRSLGRLIPKQEMQALAGLLPFVARFFVDGTHSSNAVYSCLQMGTRTDYDMKIVSYEAWREMEAMSWNLKNAAYPTITTDVRCWNPGGGLLSNDASA